jgi:hypothetical protein
MLLYPTMARRLALALLVAACSRASDDRTKLQDQPPPNQVELPKNLAIAVDVDGAPRPPITTEVLRATKPDFTDPEHRAWLIASLVAEAAPAGTTIEASAPSGVAVKFAHPGTSGLEPVIFLDRRSEVIVQAVDPKDPFPRFHGQGSRLHRPPEQLAPRVQPVAKIAITRPSK